MSPTALPDLIEAQEQLEGAGFLVHRPFPSHALPQMDPFLLLDQMGPMDVAPGAAKGAPDHPHRGFETVTYMLEGAMEHKDSHGHHGVLAPGDVQWMTAGSGVIHSEMPTPAVMEAGGIMHGVQLWVNLPAEHKMMAPRYQDIKAETIPAVDIAGGRVRVISGTYNSASAAIDTIVPIRYFHVSLEPGATFEENPPSDHNAFVYVLQGNVNTGGEDVEVHHLLRIHERTHFTAGGSGAEILVLSGPPLGEPVARYGPFVMNTRQEIEQALRDYHAGNFGSISPELGGTKPYLPGEETT